MAMAMALHHLSGFRSPPFFSSIPLQKLTPVLAVPISNAQTRERQKMKDLFKEARERCIRDPNDGVTFTVDDFHRALDDRGVGTEVGCKVKGTIFMTNADGAFVEISAKSSAFLPLREACIFKIKHVSESGIYPGLQEEFVVIGESTQDDSLILSLRSIQSDLAWERCQQLQVQDAVVKGKNSTAEELLDKELSLKFVTVDKKQSQLVLSNRKAMVDIQVQIGIGSVVIGTVCSVKVYGALVDVGGLTGLLHVSQISHERISDIATILQPGDTLKVMILSHDHERERLSLSTKTLEPTPGDMIRNPKLVFEKAEETAENFRRRIAWVEEMACTELLKSQPEVTYDTVTDSLNSEWQ